MQQPETFGQRSIFLWTKFINSYIKIKFLQKLYKKVL